MNTTSKHGSLPGTCADAGRALARCRAEQARCVKEILAGNTDHGGPSQGLIDWFVEELLIMDETGFVTKDSGQRESFETGAKRDVRAGKGRFDLIPAVALQRLAGVYERGAAKYGDRNWQQGFPFSRCYDSAMRHLLQFAAGARDEDHLAQATFNVFALMYFEKHKPELNDLEAPVTVDAAPKAKRGRPKKDVGGEKANDATETKAEPAKSDDNGFVSDPNVYIAGE